MGRFSFRPFRAVCLVLQLFPTSGCTMPVVHIQLAAFRNGEIDGVWLWRLGSDGKYTRTCRFALSDPYQQSGVEVVAYEELCPDGAASLLRMQTEVERLASDPSTVRLRLHCQRVSGPPATYRASAVNSAGESALSSTTVLL